MTPVQGDLLDVLAEQHFEDRAAREDILSRFTVSDEFTPEELVDAFEVWGKLNGRLGCSVKSHMWHLSYTDVCAGPDFRHPVVVVIADLRCTTMHPELGMQLVAEREALPPESNRLCRCVGSLVYRAWCDSCRDWTPIYDDSGQAKLERLDRCWPGWRDLPVIDNPNRMGGVKEKNLPADYPEEWKAPGAPVVYRMAEKLLRQGWGVTTWTGAIPSYSPFGGYGVHLPDCSTGTAAEVLGKD